MATAVNSVIQSEPNSAGGAKSASRISPTATAALIRVRRWMSIPGRAQARPLAALASLTLVRRPGERDDAPAGHVEQRDDCEHERRRRPVAAHRGDRRVAVVRG